MNVLYVLSTFASLFNNLKKTKMQKFKILSIVLGLFIAFVVSGQQNVNSQKLKVKITNIQNKGKTLYIGIYRASDEFPEFSKFWKNLKINTTTNETTVEFDVPFGDYAIAVSHDLNGNGKLDKNLFGYPNEPFGFSNNYKPKLSSPDFSDCKFSFTQQNNSLTIKLID
jgi:uncharacterized protein (DUF2141 family)